jgi:hypothetical protein
MARRPGGEGARVNREARPLTPRFLSLGPDNFKGLPAAARADGRAAQMQAIKDHGPCTKAQAAAHEAGHVVVGATFGQRLVSSRIDAHRGPNGTIWTGVTRMSLPGRSPSARTTAAEDPRYAFRAAIDAMAGICGELVAGLAHQASSVDERYKAGLMCRDLGLVLGLQHDAVTDMALSLCIRALAANRIAFDVIRQYLFDDHRLAKHKAAGVLARAKRIDLDDAAFASLFDSAANRLPHPSEVRA